MWESVVLLAEDFVGDGYGKIGDVVRMHIILGEDEEMRNYCVKAIKGVLKDVEGSPFGKGKKSALPVKVLLSLNALGDMIYESSLAYYASLPSGIFLRHGKSGGGVFKDGDAYAMAERKRVREVWRKKYVSGTWDGSAL
jgi:hypothetical protein